MNLTLKQYIDGIRNSKFSVQEVVKYYLDKIKSSDKNNSFVIIHDDYVNQNLKSFSDRPLHSAPIGIKDLIMTKGYETTCASNMLKGYIPPFSSTAFSNLEKNGGLMIGKTNCDQFGMGGSTENTIYGPTTNFYGTNRTSGGSSGGSAVAVAGDLCIASLGTDTGGSVRQPASFNNIVGLKPTYGRVSRYGVSPLGSSFDQIGTFTKTVEDAHLLLQSISGFDPKDATSINNNNIKNWSDLSLNFTIKGKKIAIPNQFFGQGLDLKVKEKILQTISKLEKMGAIVEYIDFPILQYGISMYYVLQTAEASTNLSRFDGIRYGLQYDSLDYKNINEYYKKIRTDGFLTETKRRILTGTFVLNSSNYEGYYIKALKARELLKQKFKQLFTKYDCIMGPTSPEVAWQIGQKKDPTQMYLADIYTVTSNLAQNCAMSVPVGFVNDNGDDMPVGLQIIADSGDENMLFGIGNIIEKMQKS